MNKRPAGRERAVRRLNKALLDELVRVHRRRSLRAAAEDGRARDQRRADIIAERIVKLGGAPDYSSLRLALRGRAHSAQRETARA